MKSLLVRLSVLALATTGFAASTIVAQSSSKTNVIKPVVIGGVCTPMCPPGHGQSCGIQ